MGLVLSHFYSILAFLCSSLFSVLFRIPVLKTFLEEITYTQEQNMKNIYEFKVKDLDGNEIELSKYRGKVLIIVNTASNCGLTKNNIKELNNLYEKFKDKDFQILGFPSNTFHQEYSCNVDIKEFVKKQNIHWDYFDRIEVNGENTEPLFKYLKNNTSAFFTKFIKWNYTKFLVNKEGVVVNRYSPMMDSPSKIEKEIIKLLE